MSLATTVLVCLALLFFGGIVTLDRINRKHRASDAGSARNGTQASPQSLQVAANGSTTQSPGPKAKVTPLARPKKGQARGFSDSRAKHGT